MFATTAAMAVVKHARAAAAIACDGRPELRVYAWPMSRDRVANTGNGNELHLLATGPLRIAAAWGVAFMDHAYELSIGLVGAELRA